MITTGLAVVFLLAICVFIHELGHFLVGKLVGIRARVFSLGYGRALFFKKKGKTIYQVTAIPLGGYVQFYGDDITKEHAHLKKGDFLAAGPWRRIAVAFAGPAFSILFGIFLIFVLFLSGWRPSTNIAMVLKGEAPAHKAGLKDGDRVVSVNGKPTEYMEKVTYYVALASEPEVELGVERDGKFMSLTVQSRSPEPGAPKSIGVFPDGDRYIMIAKNKVLGNEVLKEGDRIVTAAGQKITSFEEFSAIVDSHKGKSIEVLVSRSTGSLFQPGEREEISYNLPVTSTPYLTISGARDLQTGVSVEEIQIGSWEKIPVSRIGYNGVTYDDWEALYKAFGSPAEGSKKKVNLNIGAVPIEGEISFHSRGMLGISLAPMFDPYPVDQKISFGKMMSMTFDYTVISANSTILAIVRIFEGKLSFNKSISGPIKIMAFAAESIKMGWESYWILMAQITIVLGVMNLLPIPVLDGGHIVFYLIEALYKPLSVKVISTAMRVGVLLLLGLGVYVIGLDIIDIFVRKVFS